MSLTDDFILNVRQISQYPLATAITGSAGDTMLFQQGGIGGPYRSLNPVTLFATALEMGGWLRLAPEIGGIAFNGAALSYHNGQFTFSEQVTAPTVEALEVFVAGRAVATIDELNQGLAIPKVDSFNGRTGIVQLNESDILRAGGVLANNAHFIGTVLVPTVWDFRQNDGTAASTAWVQFVLENLLCSGSVVTSFNGRGGPITLTADDVTSALTVPGAYATANTPPLGDTSKRIATTAFVDESLLDFQEWVLDEITGGINLSAYAPINSPNFTGVPTAPTANPGVSDGQLATTAFVMHAVTGATAGVASFNTRTGAVTLLNTDIQAAGGALLSGAAFTGALTAPTATAGTSSTIVATTAFVMNALTAAGGGVTSFNTRTGAVTLTLADVTGTGILASPAFTGNPTAPTQTGGTSNTTLATTAFVANALATGNVTSFNGRTGIVSLISNDISAAGGALSNSPALVGTPTAPTAPPGTNTTQLATTAYVLSAIVSGGGAPLNSPAFTGVPTAPTATAGTNTTQLATTAFVMTALAAAPGGVSSFNSRTGAITLTLADVTGTGVLASPALSGTPTAPTATAGTSNTQIATCAFVANALAALSGVASFNGRTGAVNLIANDISGAGGALIASPNFTGTPTAPTAVPGTNTTQLATTAFVTNALGGAGVVSSFNGRAGAVTLNALDVYTASGLAWAQSDTAPAFATNRFWFDSIGGQLYVKYHDPVSSADNWVIANSPQPQAAPSGARVLITQVDVTTPVTTVDFFNGFDGTYDLLELVIYDLTGASEAQFYMRCSGDGSTFSTGAADYLGAYNQVVQAGGSPAGGVNGATSSLFTFNNVNSNANLNYTTFFIFNIRRGPGGTNNPRTGLIWRFELQNAASGLVTGAGGGQWAVTGNPPLLGIRCGISGPTNITRGSFRLYGIVK